MRYPTDETWVPLSRGIEEHLPKMVGGCRAALWILLLVRAQFSGPMFGKVIASFKELADALGVSYSTVYRAAQDLKKVGSIDYEPASNQHRHTVFTVNKYKGVEDFHPIVALSISDKSSESAAKLQRKSKPDKVPNISELQDPNNDKNEDKENNDAILFSFADFLYLLAMKLRVLDQEGNPYPSGIPNADRGAIFSAWNDYGPFPRQIVEQALDSTLKQQDKKGEILPIAYHLKAIANLQVQDGHKHPLYREKPEGIALADELVDEILGEDGCG